MKSIHRRYLWGAVILLAVLILTGFGGLLYQPLWNLIFILGGILIILGVIVLVWLGVL